ncbi:hypothetical protein B296_00051195 [Ensete ventricosum]|uniref:Uncharacterized protein n=1 Tax=Ensete ventricosum TaxID=4639 RepID=A0A426XLI4_ENSVE|nr:hypothetical protein B296_00051195 [Ensete ventricosum]
MATESASASSSNPSSSSMYSYPATTYFPLPFHLQNADPAAQQQYLPPPVKIPTAQTFPVPPPVVAGMYSLPQFQQVRPFLCLSWLLFAIEICKYVGNRPIKLRKSTWKERTDVEAMERQKFIIFTSRITFRRNQNYQRKVFCTSEASRSQP